MVIFVQRQVNQTVLEVELQAALKQARLLAVETVNHPYTLEELAQVFAGADEIAFILGADDTYLAHTDRQKVGAPADNDFTAEILGTFASAEGGSLEDDTQDQIIGYAAIPGQNAVAVIVKDNQTVSQHS